jgi:hypothetical protein
VLAVEFVVDRDDFVADHPHSRLQGPVAVEHGRLGVLPIYH